MEGLLSDPFKQVVTTEQNLHSYWPLFYAEILRHTLFSLRHMKTTKINKGT